MKPCPYCAEEIQDAAIYCRYCHQDLRKPVLPPSPLDQLPERKQAVPAATPKKNKFKSALGWGIVTGLLFTYKSLFLLLGTMTGERAGNITAAFFLIWLAQAAAIAAVATFIYWGIYELRDP